MSKGITSTEGLIRKVFAIPHDDDMTVFYRGHSNRKYKLEPSLYRKQGHKNHEDILFQELLIANPTDFSGDSSTFEKLVRMQHYSLPTRLLDITSNPLIALYFACRSDENKKETGEVVVIKVRRNKIKFFDSDTVSCIANLARLSKKEKDSIDFTLEDDPFNESDPVKRLLHFIREEKPYFLSKIVPADLKRILCVKGRMTNNRISSQSGAFLLFGLDATLPEAGNAEVAVGRITIKASEKAKILRELDSLNINESTVFPNIENSAKHIAKRYEHFIPHNFNTTP
jgi:hypothetical protein